MTIYCSMKEVQARSIRGLGGGYFLSQQRLFLNLHIIKEIIKESPPHTFLRPSKKIEKEK